MRAFRASNSSRVTTGLAFGKGELVALLLVAICSFRDSRAAILFLRSTGNLRSGDFAFWIGEIMSISLNEVCWELLAIPVEGVSRV